MLKAKDAFSSYSVHDIEKAREFYEKNPWTHRKRWNYGINGNPYRCRSPNNCLP